MSWANSGGQELGIVSRCGREWGESEGGEWGRVRERGESKGKGGERGESEGE